jgi:hypothetical protein
MRVGIDFGTTNSGIAVYDGTAMHLFRVDDFLPDLLPSIIYITRQFAEHVGSEAREIYLQQNVNRPSRFEKIWVGQLETWVSTHTSPKKVQLDVYAWNDVLAPGRLLKSVKTALRSQEYEGTRIFGELYPVEQLISIILRHLLRSVEATLGKPITAAVLGRPVTFSEDETTDKRAEALILAGARLAGLEDVRFLPEPIAAAYTFHKKLSHRQTTLIFDFGGGTLDLTVALLGGLEEPVILATEGVLIGGDDFDRCLLEYVLPHFGLGATLTDGRPIPGHIWDAVLHWEAAESQQMADVIDFVRDAAQPDKNSNPQALLARRFPAAAISSEDDNVLTEVVKGLAIWSHELDEKLNGALLPDKRQLVKRAALGESRPNGRDTAQNEAASHFIVGLASDGTVQAHPWSAKATERARQLAYWQRHPLEQAFLCGRDAPLLLGTLWSKFLWTMADGLFDAAEKRVTLPRYLQTETEIGDCYVLIRKWAELRSAQLLLLVTRNGNVRFFQRSFVETERSRYNQWQLEKGARPDIPATLLAVDKNDEVLLLTESGRAIRVQVKNISVRGQRALKLKQPEPIHALPVNGMEQVFIISRMGSAVYYPLANIPVAPRLGGAGKQVLANQAICSLLPDSERRQAFGLTSYGRIVELDLAVLSSPGDKGVVVELDKQEMLVNCWPARRRSDS